MALTPFFKDDIKIDGPKRKQIWKDWDAAFPYLSQRRKTSWSRRAGPLLLSIGYSYEYGTEYRPRFSAFNLSNPLDFLCANLDVEPRNRRSSINWRQHEYGLYQEAVDALREQAPIPIEGPVTLSRAIEGYQGYLEKRPFGDDRPFHDPALIAAWAGKSALAQELLEWGCAYHKKVMMMREETPGEKAEFYVPKWRDVVKEKIAHPEALRKTVEEQVIFHKLTKIPYEDLIIDP